MSNNITAAYISQRIAANMNIVDVTPQSKIALITQGLLTEKDIFETYKDDSEKNFYIQTADETHLEMIGTAEGVVRIKEPLLRVSKEDGIISVTKREGSDLNAILPVNYTITLEDEKYWLRLTEPVDLSLEEQFISGDVLTTSNESSAYISEGSQYIHEIEGRLFNISFKRSISIPVTSETVDEYRNRVLFARQTSKTGSIGAIRLALASVPIVTDYAVSFEKDPYEILLFNKSLLESDEDLDSLLSYSVPILTTRLLKVVSEGTVFDVSIPKKVDFSIKLKAVVPEPRTVSPSLYSLVAYLRSVYNLGVSMNVDKLLLETYLISLGEPTDFLSDYDFIIVKNFLGEAYESSIKILEIKENEYPFLNEVIVE